MSAFRERLIELLECGPEDGDILAEVIWRNRERDQWRQQMADVRSRSFRKAKHRVEPLCIAIDFDNTFTADTHLWSHVIGCMQKQGHRVVCITARRNTFEHRHELSKALPNGVDVFCAYDCPKELFAKQQGLEVDIWIDDDPAAIPHVADSAKV